MPSLCGGSVDRSCPCSQRWPRCALAGATAQASDETSPVAQTLAPTGFAGAVVVLHGTVDAGHQRTTYWFEVGPTTAYGSTTQPATIDKADPVAGDGHRVGAPQERDLPRPPGRPQRRRTIARRRRHLHRLRADPGRERTARRPGATPAPVPTPIRDPIPIPIRPPTPARHPSSLRPRRPSSARPSAPRRRPAACSSACPAPRAPWR